MDRLRQVISEHQRWKGLEDYVLRIESFVETDFSIAISNAKSLLESIAKEICAENNIEIGKRTSVNSLLKKAFTALGYPGKNEIVQISSAITTIGQNIGAIRGEVSTSAHGKTMAELSEYKTRLTH